MSEAQFLSISKKDGETILHLSGKWISNYASTLESETNLCIDKIENIKSTTIAVNTSSLEKLDTYGAWLLERLKRDLTTKGFEVTLGGLSKDDQALFNLINETNKQKPKSGITQSLIRLFSETKKLFITFGKDLLSFANMLGAITLSLFTIIKNPKSFRLTSSVHQLDKICWQAVPIILLITLLIGGIIAQQGFFHFGKLGAELYVVDMVGILVLREVGILLVAIMVAGRSGSAYTAELGSMKMREEIDALQTMGLNPIDVLILPRILMLIIALPILTFLGSMAALYGGGLVAWIYGGMTPEIFISRLKEAISLTHFQVGMIKAPFMGLVIGLVACTEGLKVKGSAESLGQQTTKSVVKAIFMVIVLDGLFAIFFASIGW